MITKEQVVFELQRWQPICKNVFACKFRRLLKFFERACNMSAEGEPQNSADRQKDNEKTEKARQSIT